MKLTLSYEISFFEKFNFYLISVLVKHNENS
jgi:hypothetical protein